MTVTYYTPQDASAPSLSGVPGSMIALLDAILVNGYGTKSAAGWTKVFSGTNIAVYRNNPSAPGSTGMYLRVDDTASNYATVKAYKTMSDLNTGTDPAPSGVPGYSNSVIYWQKSYDSSVRPWIAIADDRTLYMNVAPGGSLPSYINSYCYFLAAGDFDTYVPGNSWNYFVAGGYGSSWTDSSYHIASDQSSYGCAVAGRSQELTANKNSKIWVPQVGPDWSGGTSHYPYSPYTGLRFFYPAYLAENATQTNITGKLRGVYAYAGRMTTNWNENFGKLPDDPTGPDMIQFCMGSTTNALYVRLGNW